MLSAASLLKLLAAIAVVESNVNDAAIGDGGDARGRYQIHRGVVIDVNARFGTNFRWADMHNHHQAEWVAMLYLRHYLQGVPNATLEDAARIWNGGPDGWKQNCTRAYWKKVEDILHYMNLRDALQNPLRSGSFSVKLNPIDPCPQTPPKSSPVAPSIPTPSTAVASSSPSVPAITYSSGSSASGAKGRPSRFLISTIKPSGAKPARSPASRKRPSRPAPTR